MEKSFVRSGHTWVLNRGDMRYIGYAIYEWARSTDGSASAYHLDAYTKVLYAVHQRFRGHPLRCLVST